MGENNSHPLPKTPLRWEEGFSKPLTTLLTMLTQISYNEKIQPSSQREKRTRFMLCRLKRKVYYA